MTHKVLVEQEAVGLLEETANVNIPAEIKFATFRRGSGIFFKDFPVFRAGLKIKEFLGMAQSESDGQISLTIVYR